MPDCKRGKYYRMFCYNMGGLKQAMKRMPSFAYLGEALPLFKVNISKGMLVSKQFEFWVYKERSRV